MRMLFISMCLGLSSCSSIVLPRDRSLADADEPAVVFDTSLLRDWDRSAQSQCRTPYRVTYRKGARTLIYYAISYQKIPIQINDAALVGIQNEIGHSRPNEIIVGLTEPGLQDAKNGAGVLAKCLRGQQFTCAEPLYTAHIAYQKSIRIAAGEISPAQLLTALEAEGATSREDAMAYTSAQIIIGFAVRGISQVQWREEFEQNRTRNPAYANVKLWSYDDFREWVTQKMKSFGELENIENSWIEPRTDSGASPLQRISAIATRTRDRFLLKRVEDSLNSFGTVLMIYSNGHQRSLDTALSKALGLAKIECLK